MHDVLQAALSRMLATHQATLVVVYGSFATGTFDEASDLDLVAWAPVPEAFHDTVTVGGRELDAWIYPTDHPFDDPELVRVHPALCLHDANGRFSELEQAVAETRAQALRPLDAQAKAELASWVRRMAVRARSNTVEGLHRYHWLLSDGPELWCRFRDRPWEGPKKALGRMRSAEPEVWAAYFRRLSTSPDPKALESWAISLLDERAPTP